MDYNQLILVELHFRLMATILTENTKFTLIEKIENKNTLDKITVIIKIHEDD